MQTSTVTWDGREFRLGDHVKNALGHGGKVVSITSHSLMHVEWDNLRGRRTLERTSDIRRARGES